MKYFLVLLFCIFSLGCSIKDHQPNQENLQVLQKRIETNKLAKVSKEPYQLKLQIEKVENDKYNLVAAIDLAEGSYIASPLSNNNFTGLFNIAIDENDKLKMDKDYEEMPRSKETMDPFENVPVNWVRVNTTYKKQLNILSKKDFKVSGLIKFTIEPRCTMEKIKFIISQQSGIMKIEKI